jgi:transposase
MQVTTIGLDIAKNVFQVHGIDAAEKVVVRKQLRRSQVLDFFKALPPCLVGMEAWARRPFKVVAVALANKMARIAWALLAKGGTYHRTRALVTAVTAAA